MTTVNHVLGASDAADLGFTLTHEHVLTSSAGVQQTFPEMIDRKQALTEAVARLKEARAEGVETIVDLTTMDLGRDIRVMAEASRRSGVRIIAATGLWRDIPRVFWSAKPDTLAALFVREIESGIDGTGIKAGVIKAANDQEGVSPQGETVLRAAARAHKATGAPISTHSWSPGRVGEQQVRVLQDEGVDLGRVYIGHSNDTLDVGYLVGLLKAGVWVGLDRYPGNRRMGRPGWKQRTEVVKQLIDAGYAGKIMLSHDWSVTAVLGSPEMEERRRRSNPDGYLFITRRVLPYLQKLGISEQVVRQITVENPQRFFAGG